MGHESIESQAYFDKEFPEGCKARDTQFLNEWIQRAFNAGWRAALERAESGRTAHNTGSPKLPDSNEIRNALVEMRACQGSVVSDVEYGVLAFVYDYIVRQLLAGA